MFIALTHATTVHVQDAYWFSIDIITCSLVLLVTPSITIINALANQYMALWNI